MDRSHEERRGTMPATTNGRRRQRTSSLRDSPEDGGTEFQESTRFRDRVSRKDRERDCVSRSKRRGERLQHGSNREEVADESTEGSFDDENEEDEEAAANTRLQQINPAASVMSSSSSIPNHQLRKSFLGKNARPIVPWKVTDEIIGVSVPRKARSASVKRSQECWVSGSVSNGTEAIRRLASTSPAGTITVSAEFAAPMSPSSSNASVRKKMKPMGSKHRPSKLSKTSSISETEIEFEIAEVLYGMTRQFQCPPKQEAATGTSLKQNPKDASGVGNDINSRGSSPVSILPPIELPPSAAMLHNENSMAVAPKRKRPRPHILEDKPGNFVVPESYDSSAAKIEAQKEEMVGTSSPNLEKTIDYSLENEPETDETRSSQIPSLPAELPQDIVKTENDSFPDPVPVPSPKEESNDLEATPAKERTVSSADRSPCGRIDADEDAQAMNQESGISRVGVLIPQQEKLEIDLMAIPGKSSSERGDSVTTGQVSAVLANGIMLNKEAPMADVKAENMEGSGEVGLRLRTETIKDLDFQVVKEGSWELQVDPEKLGEECKETELLKHSTKATKNEFKAEITAQSTSSQLPMTIAGWVDGLSWMKCQIPSPLAAVSVPVPSGSAPAMQPSNPLFPRPLLKRCVTHLYIAQTINRHMQFGHMNPLWPGASGFALPCGTKQCNLNVFPTPDSAILGTPLQSCLAGRKLSSVQDNGCGDPDLNDVKISPVVFTDSSQRKTAMPQQAHATSANSLQHAPTTTHFPPHQSQPAPSAASGSVKSAAAAAKSASPSSVSKSSLGSVLNSGPAFLSSFSHALLPNEAQYLAMLQNNGYSFPMPTQGEAPPLFSSSHHTAVPVPFFSGPFYPNQMPHLSQLQHPLLQSQALSSHLVSHDPNATMGASNLPQRHHLQHERSQGCLGAVGISSGFPAMKQYLLPQQHYLRSNHSRQLECEIGSDSRCSGDARVSNHQKGVLNHNLTMPVHPQNLTITGPSALSGANQANKQQQRLEGGAELNQSQASTVSFPAFSNAAASPRLDFSSITSHHISLGSISEPSRHNQVAPSAPSPIFQLNDQEKKLVTQTVSSNSSAEERKMKMASKAPTTTPHTLGFSRADSDYRYMPSVFGNIAVDSPSKHLNGMPATTNGAEALSRIGVVPSPAHSSTIPLTSTSMSLSNQQRMIQLKQVLQQQLSVLSKSFPCNTNANLYPDGVPSIVGKFPNSVSVFPQAESQNSMPAQLPQLKAPPAKAVATAITSEPSVPSARNLQQLQGSRTRNGPPVSSGHTQISFVASTKTSPVMQQFNSNNISSQSSMLELAGSPPPPSMSRSGASGSPRATSTHSSKLCHNPMPSSFQPAKNTPSSSSSSRKSSPVSIRREPSLVVQSNVSSAQASSAVKTQQQQLSKLPLLQKAPQPVFPTYMHAHSPQSTSNSNNSGSCQKQQPPDSLPVSSTGMCVSSPSVSFSGGSCSDPAKSDPATVANMKSFSSHAFLQAAQFAAQSVGNPHLLMSAAIPYIHAVPAALPVKSGEEKPAAGSDILHHPSWQHEKR